ncbi:MAG: DUF11 domain-containing protein [Acidobacteria bacterium]|nr:DUF11 domain-containing protein [Acidobacteriota bacterium]
MNYSNPITIGPASPSPNPAVGANGISATFNLGTVTNSNTNNAVAETITITYRAVVLNTAINQAGQLRNNSAVLSFTGGTLPAVSAPEITIIAPQVGTTKTVSINGGPEGLSANGDADDPVVFKITLTQAANSPDAFEVTVNDPIPGVVLTPMITSVVDSAGLLNLANFTLSGNTLQSVAPFDLISQTANRTITITVSGVLAQTVMPGQSFPNTATTRWSSLDGTPGQRSLHNVDAIERDGSGGVNDYISTGTATVNIFPTDPTKSIARSSEAHTADPNLAIGEIVRYRLRIRLPEGSTTNLQFKDNIPAGLQYINDGTAKFAFVTNMVAGINSTTLTAATTGCNGLSGNPSIILSGDETTINTITPACTLPDTAVSNDALANTDVYAGGTAVFFKLGNLVNGDMDANLEYVLVEFNALVLNDGVNIAGVTRTNNFNVFDNGANVGTSNNIVSTILEPNLILTKGANPVTGDAGDTITYTVNYTNSGPNSATAFETRMLDVLPPFLTLNVGSVNVIPAFGASGITNISAGNTVDVAIGAIPVGGSVMVTYTAVINANTYAGQKIPNTVNLAFSSLPMTGTSPNGTGTNTPGGSGAPNGERDGSGLVNNYTRTASSLVTVNTPTISKLAPSPTSYTIGDQVVYNLLVTLPEGITRNLVVSDDLPAGMSYVGHSLITTAIGSGGILTNNYNGGPLAAVLSPVSPGDGALLAFSFGDVTTVNDNVAASNAFILRVVAKVNNISTNVNTTPLTNVATVGYTDPNTNTNVTSGPSSQTVSVIEPRLQVNKTVSKLTAECGELLTYTITVSHAPQSTATAYDVELKDVIPTGMIYDPGSLMVFSAAPPSAAPTTLTELGQVVTAQWGSFPMGSSVTIKYRAKTPTCPPATSNQVFPNTANLNWTSQSGTTPDERTGVGGGVNNYNTSSSASVTIQPNDLAITKDDGSDTYIPGGPISYTIMVVNNEAGTANGFNIADTVPAVITGVTVTCTPTGVASCGTNASAGNIVSFTGASLTGGPGNFLKIVVSGTVSSGTTGPLSNTASIVIPPGAPFTDINPANNSATDVDNAAPRADLAIDKIGPLTIIPGQTITYSLVVTNGGISNVVGARIVDALPASLINATWSCVPTGAAVRRSQWYGKHRYDGDIAAGAANKLTYTINATVKPDTTQPIINTASVTPPPGTYDPTPDNNQDTVTTTPTPRADLSLVKSTQQSPIGAGGTVNYTYVLRNNGPSDSVAPIVLDDDLPAGVTFVSANTSGAPGFACMAGAGPVAPAPGVGSYTDFHCLMSSGSIPSGAQYTILVAAQIDPNANAGVLTNRAQVRGTTTDPDLTNNTSTSDVTVVRRADLAIVKQATPNAVKVGDQIVYTIKVTNNGPSNVRANEYQVTDPTFPITNVPIQGTITAPGFSCNGLSVFPCVGNVDLAPGAMANISFTVQLSAGFTPVPGTILNTATVGITSTGTTNGLQDSDSTNNSSTVQTPVSTALADLAIEKTAVPSSNPLVAGSGTISYSLKVSNLGPADAVGVRVTDTVPANTTVTSVTIPANWSCTGLSNGTAGGTTFTCQPTGTMANGAMATISYVVSVGASVPQGTLITNTANIGTFGPGATPDPSTGNNTQGPTQTLVTAVADVEMVKSDSTPPTVVAGSATVATYTVTVRNYGPSDAQSVEWVDALPAGLLFESISVVPGWNCVTPAVGQGGTVRCTTPVLAAGNPGPTSVNFTLGVKVAASYQGTTINNIATVTTATSQGANAKPDTDNGVTAVQTDAAVTVIKTDTPDPVVAGENVTYTIVVSNAGPSDAQNVQLTDPFPSGLTIVSVSGTGALSACAANGAGTALNCPAVTLGAGQSATVTVVAKVGPGTSGPLSNTATVTWTDNDGNPNDNTSSSTATTTVNRKADLAIEKKATPEAVKPGDEIVYTIKVTNNGPSSVNANEYVVSDTPFPPSGTTLVGGSLSAPGFNCTGGAAIFPCTGPALAPGEMALISVRVKVNATFTPVPGVIANTAKVDPVSGTGYTDPNPTNDSSTVQTPVSTALADLAIEKMAVPSSNPLVAGSGTISYSLKVSNLGPADAVGVRVTETVPANTTVTSVTIPANWSCTGLSNGTAGGTTFTCQPTGTMANGAMATISYVVSVGAGVPQGTLITNTANVGTFGPGATPDPSTGNNTQGPTQTLVTAVADVEMVKSDSTPPTVVAGSATVATYTVTVRNYGPSDAQSVEWVDALPAGLLFESISVVPGWNCVTPAVGQEER